MRFGVPAAFCVLEIKNALSKVGFRSRILSYGHLDRSRLGSGGNPGARRVSIDGTNSITVAKANTKVEDTLIKTIVIGDAYLEKGKKDTRRTFLCLIGEKGKVLLTFFTDK